MIEHEYFGLVEENWLGYSSALTFKHPFFIEEVEILVGDEFDEDGEEIDTPPSREQLDELVQTHRDFVKNIEVYLKAIQERAYEYYQKFYAHYYEDEVKSGEAPLQIDSVEKHNAYIKELMAIRFLPGGGIIVPIHYNLDVEHGLEFRFTNGVITDVGGIAQTY